MKGFSTNINIVNRWIFNALHRAALRKCPHDMVHSQQGSSKHADLQKSRIMKDLSPVQNIINVLQETFINQLTGISNDLPTTDIVRDNLLNAVD